MSTLRKLVSDVRGMHKLLSTDTMITDRVIASDINNNNNLLVKRETNLRKLWATDTIFKTIGCLEMEQVPISECCDYVDECSVARSKVKLPSIAEGNYQYLIQGVYSINALSGKGTKFTEITINRYINLLKLPIIKKESYYWIVNDYLYISNPLIQAVRFVAMFDNVVHNTFLYPECGCYGKQVSDEEYCMNPLDRESSVPGYLEKQVLDLTSQKLLQTYFQLKTDLTSDGIDGQAPNVPPTR
jgi:hypothetical protein